MLVPTKHENLNKNTLVLGGEIIKYLKLQGDSSIEAVFQYIKDRHDISIEKFYDTITYLWLIDFIKLSEAALQLNKKSE